ncbi:MULTISPECIES: hypothetical protein [unclassified Pseudovibrio]|uniref:hypothetical protein n=1 Tax=unclassified Pseudovibrio TaxID=2627060 RepID=UPI0007AEE4B9|nr:MULTISPECIES: hypothetical protein [unclassified Pseudovibrio]KZK94813.1 hypothetical protein PsW74_04476 [Pseudovibrio sp. W74]KZL04628.1 hypothetical protein PsAD14_04859 [Pseudovibrio sp. Ad14]
MFQNSFGSQTRRKQKTVVSALRVPVTALIALDLAVTSRFARAEDIDRSTSLTVDSDPSVSDHTSPWDVDDPLNSGVTAGSDAKITIQNGREVTNTGGTIGVNSGSHGTVTVSGSRSQWQATREFKVGSAGTSALNIADGGTLARAGTINDPTTVTNGTVAAGNSPSTLTIDGDLDHTFASVMDFELGSPSSTAGVDSDLIRLWLSFSDFSLSRDRRTCNA